MRAGDGDQPADTLGMLGGQRPGDGRSGIGADHKRRGVAQRSDHPAHIAGKGADVLAGLHRGFVRHAESAHVQRRHVEAALRQRAD